MAAIEWLRRRQAALAQRARADRGAAASACALGANALGALVAVLAAPAVSAVELPANRAELMYHRYDGGGVTADGPALLVRKSLLDRVSLSASYYVDMVSNASIDVITNASPYSERRNETGIGLDYAVRNGLISLSATRSDEPDYKANAVNVDLQQEVFGGMTTVNVGYSRGFDDVGRRDLGFFDSARHWRYRLGVTQILTPTALATLNAEAMSDDGYLANPYRSALVFGARVPERVPRTRTGRAVNARASMAIGPGALRADYRYYWDTWEVRAHSVEAGYARTAFAERWLLDGWLRYHRQSRALFYSDNAQADTLYVTRNRQLGSFDSVGVGLKASYTWLKLSAVSEVKLHGALEHSRYSFSDFTDVRNGQRYRYSANVVQLFASASF